MSPSITQRNTGLDILRACAIALVFMYHYMIFVSGEATFGRASVIGWVGVDLFFVLSGYLIANQLFAGLVQGKRLSVLSFYLRRGLRTWPAFWVVLAAYFLFPDVMGGKTPPPLWTFLTFTQNLGLEPGTAFSHAWSLCIEEQFYFVLPIVLLAASRLGSRRWQAWIFLGTLTAIGITARAVLWSDYGHEGVGQANAYMSRIYYSTLCRFDEFIPGVALALLKHFHPALWQRLMKHGKALLGVAIAASSAMLYVTFRYYYIDGYGYGFFMTSFGYSLLAVSFALLVAAALSPQSPLYDLHIPGAHLLALWSYSIYLTHKAVGNVMRTTAQLLDLSPSGMVILTILASLFVGALLYQVVEEPLMKLRDRYFPSNFADENPSPDKEFATGNVRSEKKPLN